MTFTRRFLLAGAAATAILAGALTAPAMAADKTTLVIANSQWLDALRGQNLWAALKTFEESHPDIVLEQEAIPSKDYADRLMTEMGAQQGPDIMIVQEGLFYSLVGAEFLVPLDDVTEGVTNLNATNDNGVVDGTRLGIAWQRAVYALIFNKALLQEAGVEVPSDLDGMIAAAKATMEATGAIGFTGRHSMNEFGAWFMDFQNWAYGYGVNWVDSEGNLTINTPEAVAAFDAFKAAYDSGIMPIGDPMTTQRTRFKEQQVAFSIDNSGGSLNIASGGALPSADMGAAPLPFANPGAHQQIFLGLSKFSEAQPEAKAFLAWLISDEGQQALRAASGPDALATDVPVTDAFQAENPWAAEFAELAKTSRTTLIPGYELETTSIMRPVMTALEKVLLGAATSEEALAEAEAEIHKDFN
ncbi:sugar ABC transporter substrate-binding protein [Rhodobacter sp. TJ_12]|uniref:ABC transporter substrate-binding protein n=1 Tax=Rhodobacter sp. TJ_12 TaxID=2029399 RepID=UPI001CBBF6D7|nr:extracellular solute-binding protein [Rhodobacter sp. TJ_12]MBZ4021564.1 sugar ABC transporter substrate-binding protein [Rhodobacter sp. TJ_12]